MRLYLAGINHFDPLMRAELIHWLRELAQQEGTNPCFVAVEWGEQPYLTVVAAREQLKECARKKWGNVSEERLLTPLANAMGYEGDAHREVWGDVETLWLDDARAVGGDDERLQKYAEARFKIYNSRIENVDPTDDPEGALRSMHEHAYENQSQWEDTGRDGLWSRQIVARLAKGDCTWGVVVAGEQHFAKHRGNVRDLLEVDTGGTCTGIDGSGHLVRRVLNL